MTGLLLSLLLTPLSMADELVLEEVIELPVAEIELSGPIVCLQWIKPLPLDDAGKSHLMMTPGNFDTIERPTTTPVLAEKLTSVPGVRLDGQGRVALRDMQAHELGIVMDGTWMPGATLTSAKGGSPHVTPVQAAPFSIRR